MKTKAKQILFLVFLLGALTPLSVFSQSFSFHQYTPEDGLPSSTIYSIDQDSKGVMWFGTENGLSSFDGIQYRNFTIQDGLPGNLVFGVTIDHRDRKWLSILGKGVYCIEGDSIFKPEWLEGISSRNSIVNFSERDSSIYVFIYTTTNDGLVNKKKMFGLPGDSDKANVLQFWLVGPSVPMVDLEKQTISSLGECRIMYFENGQIIDSLETADFGHEQLERCVPYQNKLICFSREEFFRALFTETRVLDLDKKTSREILPSLKEYLTINKANWMMVDQNDNLWLSTNSDLLLIQNPLSAQPIIRIVLEGLSVTRTFEDLEGNIWIGTEGEGLYFLSNAKVKSYSSQEYLAGNKIMILRESETGELWVGYSNGFVEVFDEKLKSIWKQKISANRIRDILFSETGTYLISNSDITLIDQDFNTKLLANSLSLKTGALLNEELYLFTYNIYRLDEDGLTECEYDRNDRIYSVFPESDSTIWLGSSTGLISYNFQKEELGNLFHPELDLEVKSLIPFHRNSYWVSTMGKGVFLIQGDSILKHYTTDDGLCSNICFDLLLNQSDLWVATNAGISIINIETDEVQILNKKDGLGNNEFSYFILQDEVLIAAGDGGLDVIPVNQKSFSDPPIISINSVQVNGVDRDLPLSNLSYQDNNIQIEFQAISYKSLGEFSYAYRTTGAGSNWISTNSSSINLNELSSGHFQLEFRAKGRSTDWGYYPPIEFEISPPWWRSWWFLTLLGFFLLSSIVLIFRGVLARQRARNKIEQQLKELELTALRAQMNPHFLFNALNSINWFINRNDADSANLYMAKFALLIRKILTNSGKSRISLSEEIEQLELYLELENLRMDNTMDYSISVADDIDTGWIMVPGMLIQPYVENAILHGLVPQSRTRKLDLSFALTSESVLKCEIIDSGIGIETSLQLKGETSNDDRPHAMEIAGKRLKLINIPGEEQVTLKVKQLVRTGTKEVLGTKVELQIPIETF